MKQDVIIIGGGIIGLATAECLLKAGASVTIVERNQVGREASWAGGGILSPLYPWCESEEINRLARYSASLFPDWTTVLCQSSGINCEYLTSGMLVLPPFDQQLAKNWCEEYSIRTDKNMPALSYQENEANPALNLPDIAQVRSPRLLQALDQCVTDLGGQIIEHCEVNDLTIQNNSVQSLNTSRGTFAADQYIIAAGAWSTELLKQHALNLTIKPVRGQMLLFHFDAPPVSTIVLQHGRYLIPRKDGFLLIGSTLEEVGFDKSTTQSAHTELLDWAKKLLPQLHGKPVVKHWAGLRPQSSSGAPVIGRHPILRNLYVNSGHYRYGVTMAPASAKILLNHITGLPQPFDITPYQKDWHTRK